MAGQDLRETPDLVKGVVKRCRRDPDYVGLAKVCLHPGSLQFAKQLPWMFLHENGKLTAPFVRRRWRDDFEKTGRCQVEKELEIAGETVRFFAQPRHSTGLVENRQRSAQGRHGQNR